MASPKKFFPHEQMMESFRKEKRVHRENLSLKAIMLDHKLQAREKSLDIDNVKALHTVVKDGMTLSPITVFRINGVDYVGNGFHRVEVHRKEGLPSILADVITDATWKEAVEFAACCNLANHALSPTKDDRKKAVFMLLANGWLQREDIAIAEHTGVGFATVAKYRIEYCDTNRIACPSVIRKSDGKKRKMVCPKNLKGFQVIKYGKEKKFVAVDGGAEIILGSNKKEATEKLDQLRSKKEFRYESIGPDLIRSTMNSYGISWKRCTSSILDDVNVGVAGDRIVYAMRDKGTGRFYDRSLVSMAVGALMVLGAKLGMETAPKVILTPEPFTFLYNFDEVFEKLGIEFMDLDQFLKSAKVETEVAEEVA